MVQLRVKHGGDGDTEEEFIFDCQITSSVDEIAEAVIEIANFQSKIQSIAFHLEPRLSPLPHTDLQPKGVGILVYMNLLKGRWNSSFGTKGVVNSSRIRWDQVQHNKPLSVYVLRDQVNSIRREFSVHYHAMNFPDSNLQQLRTGLEHLDEGTTQLLWAGKELTRGKKLCDYIGKNERTKIILRLQSPRSHPASNPVKEHFCHSKY
ncbi:hypothetical protein RJ639_034693 [Escallonia herrerae]|uniref:Ubiquitin-like domain-containing protein n=1 Tax=Escallonia herrerae TaxID=1293975 RepID=A0AA89BJY5_9ASTE|nr:hypothetical protein RJ639_034693 [Escallonia herrerae]